MSVAKTKLILLSSVWTIVGLGSFIVAGKVIRESDRLFFAFLWIASASFIIEKENTIQYTPRANSCVFVCIHACVCVRVPRRVCIGVFRFVCVCMCLYVSVGPLGHSNSSYARSHLHFSLFLSSSAVIATQSTTMIQVWSLSLSRLNYNTRSPETIPPPAKHRSSSI